MFKTILTILVCLMIAVPVLAQAPIVGDRSEIEERKRQDAEKAKLRAEAEVKETPEQREARERVEKKEANAKTALKRAQEAIQAANARQNKKGMELMQAAWILDPVTVDYSYNTAAFAEALEEFELEFRAMAQVLVLTNKSIPQFAEGSPQRDVAQAKQNKAKERLEFLKTKLSTGLLKIRSEPTTCEIFMEGAYVGIGEGEILAVTGARKVEARCNGHYDTELFVNVREGDPTEAVIKPKAISYFGKLVVKVDPEDGVTVFLDDVPIADRMADTPTKDGKIKGDGSRKVPYELSARKWVIRFQKDGYDRWHRRIEVRRDQVTVVEAKLESMADLEEQK